MTNEEACLCAFLGCGALLVALVGWVWLAVAGFRTSTPWGILLVLFPTFAAPCFALYPWKVARLPMCLHCGGIAVIVVGARLVQ